MNDSKSYKNWLNLFHVLIYFVFFFGSHSFADDKLSAEQRLEVLRQSLLDEALSGEVDIVSSAYVDSDGQIHESAYITANKSIRGVRVAGYVNPLPTQSPLPLRRRADDSCVSNRYRPQLVVSATAHGDPNTRIGSVYLSAVVSETREHLLRILRDNSQVVVVESDDGLYQTEYDAILARANQGVGSYNLKIEVGMDSAQAGKIDKGIYEVGKTANSIWQYVPFFNIYRGSPANIAGGISYKLEVTQVDQSKIVFAANEDISFRSQPEPTRDTILPRNLREEIKESVGDILEEGLGGLLCEPERIVTRRAEDGTYSLLAGQAAGVTSGDQFILVRSAVWERDRLDIKDVAELALARVEFVYPQESAIKVIAGPNAPDSGSLIAVPF